MEQRYRYTYAVARIRYLERELLTKPFFHSLVEAPTFEDTKKLLGETVYGLSEEKDFDVLWEDETRRVSKIVRELMPDMRLAKFFGYGYDIFNLKVLFKNRLLAKRGLQKNWDVLVDMGTISIDRLVSIVENEIYEYLPFHRWDVAYLVKELVAEMEKDTLDTRFVDLTWDKIYFKFLLQEAFASGEEFLVKYVKTLIDITNILTFFRSKMRDEEKSYLATVLIDGGMVDTEKFINNYQENLDGIVKALAYSPYGKLIADVVSVFEEKRSLAVIEKQVDNYLVSFVDRCRYIMFGIEPVVAFWIAKEIEVKNLRIIITGKRAGIPDELLKERLRDVYA